MANYYTDIPELKYHLNNPMMERICELKERNYRDKEEFDYAPQELTKKAPTAQTDVWNTLPGPNRIWMQW